MLRGTVKDPVGKKQMMYEVILSNKLSVVAKPMFLMKDADASISDVIIWMFETEYVGHKMAIGLFCLDFVLA